MKILAKSGVLLFSLAGLAAADSYTGILIDATCTAEQKGSPSCNPTASTTSFALIVSGDRLKTLKLDASGNAKAASALKENHSGANRAKDPNTPGQGSFIVTVTGAVTGDEIKVDSIQVD